MKSFFLLSGAISGLLLAGCSTEPEHVDPFNNYPDVRTGNIPMDTGTLTVEGIPRAGMSGGQGKHGPELLPLYSVYDEAGNFLKDVTDPSTSLAPGRYLIRVESDQFKPVPFWVTVVTGKTTFVDARTIELPDGKTLNAD